MGLKLKDLLVRDDVKKDWHKLLMELGLGSWRKLGENKSKAAEAGVSDSGVLVLESLAGGLHSHINVLLEVVSARLGDETEGEVSSLAHFPAGMSKAFGKDRLGSFEDEVLLHVHGKSSDCGKTSRVNIVSGAIFSFNCLSPSVHISLALGHHLNESGEEVGLHCRNFSKSCGNLSSKSKDDLSSLRSGTFLEIGSHNYI